MSDYVIITEKSSAMQNFAMALGSSDGSTGTYAGKSYHLVHLHGHMLALADPAEQTADDSLSQWQMQNMPWPAQQFQWKKIPMTDGHSNVADLQHIARIIKQEQPSALVVATDTDPSGEGDVLALEAINYWHWQGRILRCNFRSEEAPDIQAAFKDMRDITDYQHDSAYLRGIARERFDFLSMQHTRMATLLLRQAGYDATLRLGRLKTVIIVWVYEQLEKYLHYHKQPYYEIHWADAHNNDYVLADSTRYDDEGAAQQALAALQQQAPVTVASIKHVDKHTAPPSLPDLATLGSMINKKGFKNDDILNTYQQMYEAKIVSYPRTSDTKITQADFQAQLAIRAAVAAAVNVPTTLLTHDSPRPKYIAKAADHGGNRPGKNVPASLDELATKYGQVGVAIYDYLARHALVMFADDAVQDVATVTLSNGATFTTAKTTQPGWLTITKNTHAHDDFAPLPDIGSVAKPYIYHGVNKRPPLPTQSSLVRYLKKVNVGTGATRLATITNMLQSNSELTMDKQHHLKLTPVGTTNAAMSMNTTLGDATTTATLQKTFNAIGDGQQSIDTLYTQFNDVLKRDKDILAQHAANIKTLTEQVVTKLPAHRQLAAKTAANSFAVTYQGKEYRIRTEWGGEALTADQIKALQAGDQVTVTRPNKKGGTFRATLHVGTKRYRGKDVVTIIAKFNDD